MPLLFAAKKAVLLIVALLTKKGHHLVAHDAHHPHRHMGIRPRQKDAGHG